MRQPIAIHIGKTFGHLLVKEVVRSTNKAFFDCQCVCGNRKTIAAHHVLSGATQSCGCFRRDDLTGQRFGRLVAVNYVRADKYKRALWNCRCDCGKYIVAALQMLKVGDAKSCGCLYKDTRPKPKHGMSGTKEYSAWKGMRSRCCNSKNPVYAHYGGRGITVVDSWCGENGFEIFLSDMGKAPSNTHCMDRIDPNGNYTKTNCRWAISTDLPRTRSSLYYPYRGCIKTLIEWTTELNIDYSAVYSRLRHGWTFEEAINEPCRLPYVNARCSSKEYRTWAGMKQRCLNPDSVGYSYYGARGVKVCDRWIESFDAFFQDMGKAPSKQHSIDRRNNNEGYTPSNCRWATKREQALNRTPRKGVA